MLRSWFLSVGLTAGLLSTAHCDVFWEQTISREHPVFQIADSRMALGRDGRVYLSSMDATGMANPGHVLRLSRDGKERFGGDPGPATNFVTANAQGIIASANAHFNHAVTLYDENLVARAKVTDFSPGNRFNAPARVEAGTGGDFYGLDQFADRIVRLNPRGEVVKVYTYTREPSSQAEITDFRVDEKNNAFFLQWGTYQPLRKVGFDGKTQWTSPQPASGGFDVDAEGVLYTIDAVGDKVLLFAPDGKPLGEVPLQLGNLRQTLTTHQFRYLRVWEDELLLKRVHPQELFLRFDLNTGALQNAVPARFERLAVTLPNEVWSAGAAVPFKVEFQDPMRNAKPRWRVWGRTLGALDYQEFALENGNLKIPANAGGVYQIKVSPEVTPWQHDLPSEYLAQGWVEIRQPGTQGTLNVWTPENRTSYGRGEAIPVTVLARGAAALDGKSVSVNLRLVSTKDATVHAQSAISLTGGKNSTFSITPTLTRALVPGWYRIEATASGLTTVAQPVFIGAGLQTTNFPAIHYGDYESLWPGSANATNAPDLAAAWALRAEKRGVNLLIERLGAIFPGNGLVPSPALAHRLKSDPLATAPEKASMAHGFVQTLAAHGACGTQQMSILLGNDQGLPMGAEYGGPPPTPESREKFKSAQAENILRVTRNYQSFPAFRGWSWAANWWLTDSAKEPSTPEGKTAHQSAVKRALETGKWEPLIDKVADQNLGYASEATAWFNEVLRKENPKLKTAVAAPYRNGQAHPPLALRNVDEVDLQAQWEQIAPPNYAAHNVDYYERPGKPSLGHPEVWNDSGTGEQLLPTLFQMLMRGADGVGYANHLLNWDPEDSRNSQGGTASIVRAMNGVLRQYGPWISGLSKNDRVAIVVSSRMIKLDEWKLTTHRAILEAYLTCLHAHHPASIIFSEDMRLDSLKKFKAILVVGQRVEMEPPLKAALDQAKAAGVRIFRDGTCRSELVKEYASLGVSFDKLVHEHGLGVGGDESAYPRVLAITRANLPAVRKALDSVMPPVARPGSDEVWITERTSGAGRFVFVVNNTLPEVDSEHLWRMNLYSGSMVPVDANVKLANPTPTIYDVFAMQRVVPQNGTLTANLRVLPARLYAMLPAPIGSIALRGPATLSAGNTLKWWVQVRDAKGTAIPVTVPIRIRLLGPGNQIVDERFLPCGTKGLYGDFSIPLNAAGNYHLEAVELFSGKASRLPIRVTKPGTAFSLTDFNSKVVPPTASGKTATIAPEPVARTFGPRIRDVVLSGDGRVAIMNAMNWDDNLFAVDTATGKLLWRKRVGQYYAFAPHTQPQGFAVHGFDFETPEGYQLYLGDTSGKLERRFSLYGVPPRLSFRMYPGAMHDRINNFAASPQGDWFASSGNLGLAVWDRTGKLLWSQDDWKQPRTQSRFNQTSTWDSTRPPAATLLPIDANTLLVADAGQLSLRDPKTGTVKSKVDFGDKGQILRIRASKDGATIALLTRTDSGQITLLRSGQLFQTIPAKDAYDFEMAPDASALAVMCKNQLKLHDGEGGLRWVFSGDDRLRFARFSPTGDRIAVATDLGTVVVLDKDGKQFVERDLKALAVPCWLPDGGLLLATWMGDVHRLDAQGKTKWSTHLETRRDTKRMAILEKNQVPTSLIPGWGNEAESALPITPNLLAGGQANIRFPNVERDVQNDFAILTDGKPDAPAHPWIFPGELNQWAGLRFFNPITIELKAPVRATAMTFFEDPKHPASWLRDADIEYWDESTKQWVYLQSILANSAVHTHKFPQPVQTSKVRILLPFGLYGNSRLGELVLHGG